MVSARPNPPCELLPGVWRRAHKHKPANTANLYEIREFAGGLDAFDVRALYARLVPGDRGVVFEWSRAWQMRGDTVQVEFCDDPRCEELRRISPPGVRVRPPWAVQLSRGARYASASPGASRAERLRTRAHLVAWQLTAGNGGLPAFVVARELGLHPELLSATSTRPAHFRLRGVQPGFVRGSHPEVELLHVLLDDVPEFTAYLIRLHECGVQFFTADRKLPAVVNPRRLRRFLSVLPSVRVFHAVRALNP